MPLIGPRWTPYRTAELTFEPAAVVAVWVPCPSESRAEHTFVTSLQNSLPSEPTRAM